ncbi:DUF485 domain-containing protein [Methylobacterium haplocladii]|uniref:DUF485 domain-containing protein n=1 Tax=Methylobacterium haplocladii TaxID=1176176 RepID=A0A512IIY0_9HYPH|nr:DUF485 domain-containing protein [Methylobacterium haplocladii]GEO97622.1 hypothetical protein MHA02_00100 [Methylobacterium haplocladii]GJD84503.1 hypothetical protein HPGCJGGD_2380 [Methylobacterium haplocladii]GLS57352.1 hypothetical protein GCM10007887_00070 [Methylobacterium haplocladii]
MTTTQTLGATRPLQPHGKPDLDAIDLPDPALQRVASNPTFQTLVRERTRFGWVLTILMLIVYFGFIGLIAFDKPLLATKIAGTASLGLFLGVGVILFAFILTGIYVVRANTRFDSLAAELARSLAR